MRAGFSPSPKINGLCGRRVQGRHRQGSRHANVFELKGPGTPTAFSSHEDDYSRRGASDLSFLCRLGQGLTEQLGPRAAGLRLRVQRGVHRRVHAEDGRPAQHRDQVRAAAVALHLGQRRGRLQVRVLHPAPQEGGPGERFCSLQSLPRTPWSRLACCCDVVGKCRARCIIQVDSCRCSCSRMLHKRQRRVLTCWRSKWQGSSRDHVDGCQLSAVDQTVCTRQQTEVHLATWCRASLGRLGIEKVGLYQIHWPGFITNGFQNDAFVRGLADCANQGLASAVGVSNFKADRVRTASRILKARPRCPLCCIHILPESQISRLWARRPHHHCRWSTRTSPA